MKQSRRLLFLVTEDWYFVSHRLRLAEAAIAAGYDVALAARLGAHRKALAAARIEAFDIDFDRPGRNPLTELRTMVQIVRAYRRFAPDLVHHVAMKPVIYGSMAARLCRVKGVVNALAGMGYVFSSSDTKARLLRPWVSGAYAMTLKHGQTIVQNEDDRGLLLRMRGIREDRITLVAGAGVDIRQFAPSAEPAGEPVVVLPSRMLRDKGVAEFVAAADLLRKSGVKARFVLVGAGDPGNPATLTDRQLEEWDASGVVEWWRWRENMVEVYQHAHIVCLPSYREGLPKSLIEAAACGKPIVTTDVPGCREAVIEGETGLLVPARGIEPLAVALKKLIGDAELRRSMGTRARALAIRRFAMDRVISETLAVYERALGAPAI